MLKIKKLFVLAVMLLGLFSAFPVFAAVQTSNHRNPITIQAAGSNKIQLNDKNMIFYAGGKYTLKLENAKASKVIWKSSDKSVAVVDKKGKVTAKKIGKCTVVARYNGKKYTCKVSVCSDQKFLKSWCKSIAKQIKKHNKSPYDQVLVATGYVAQNFHYGSAKTPFEVLTKGKGTCVSANKLLVEMLHAMGFEAKLRFAAKDDMSRYPEGIFFMAEHHNVKVKIKGKNYYVDGTPETGLFYMSSEKKPIYCNVYAMNYVMIDERPK